MQIEYALNAVKNGQPSVGLRGKVFGCLLWANFKVKQLLLFFIRYAVLK